MLKLDIWTLRLFQRRYDKMNRDYQCKKCGNIFQDEQSDKFVKTTLKKCPNCGSAEVVLVTVSKKSFAKKSNT